MATSLSSRAFTQGGNEDLPPTTSLLDASFLRNVSQPTPLQQRQPHTAGAVPKKSSLANYGAAAAAASAPHVVAASGRSHPFGLHSARSLPATNRYAAPSPLDDSVTTTPLPRTNPPASLLTPAVTSSATASRAPLLPTIATATNTAPSQPPSTTTAALPRVDVELTHQLDSELYATLTRLDRVHQQLSDDVAFHQQLARDYAEASRSLTDANASLVAHTLNSSVAQQQQQPQPTHHHQPYPFYHSAPSVPLPLSLPPFLASQPPLLYDSYAASLYGASFEHPSSQYAPSYYYNAQPEYTALGSAAATAVAAAAAAAAATVLPSASGAATSHNAANSLRVERSWPSVSLPSSSLSRQPHSNSRNPSAGVDVDASMLDVAGDSIVNTTSFPASAAAPFVRQQPLQRNRHYDTPLSSTGASTVPSASSAHTHQGAQQHRGEQPHVGMLTPRTTTEILPSTSGTTTTTTTDARFVAPPVAVESSTLVPTLRAADAANASLSRHDGAFHTSSSAPAAVSSLRPSVVAPRSSAPAQERIAAVPLPFVLPTAPQASNTTATTATTTAAPLSSLPLAQPSVPFTAPADLPAPAIQAQAPTYSQSFLHPSSSTSSTSSSSSAQSSSVAAQQPLPTTATTSTVLPPITPSLAPSAAAVQLVEQRLADLAAHVREQNDLMHQLLSQRGAQQQQLEEQQRELEALRRTVITSSVAPASGVQHDVNTRAQPQQTPQQQLRRAQPSDSSTTQLAVSSSTPSRDVLAQMRALERERDALQEQLEAARSQHQRDYGALQQQVDKVRRQLLDFHEQRTSLLHTLRQRLRSSSSSSPSSQQPLQQSEQHDADIDAPAVQQQRQFEDEQPQRFGSHTPDHARAAHYNRRHNDNHDDDDDHADDEPTIFLPAAHEQPNQSLARTVATPPSAYTSTRYPAPATTPMSSSATAAAAAAAGAPHSSSDEDTTTLNGLNASLYASTTDHNHERFRQKLQELNNQVAFICGHVRQTRSGAAPSVSTSTRGTLAHQPTTTI